MGKPSVTFKASVFLVLSMLLTLSIASCASPDKRMGYKISNKVVWQGVDSSWDKVLKGVNPYKFKAYSEIYGTDGQHVYYSNKIVPGADPKTFVAVHGNAAHDSHAIYWMGEPVKSCDPSTFHALNTPNDPVAVWYADSKCIYYAILRMNLVSHAETKTFKPITGYYGKDAKHVYYQTQIIDGADASTFHRNCGISIVTGRDARQCYFGLHVVPCDCSPHSYGEWPLWRKRRPSDTSMRVGEYFNFYIDPSDASEFHRVNSHNSPVNTIQYRSNSTLFGIYQSIEVTIVKGHPMVTIAQAENTVIAKLRSTYDTVKITKVDRARKNGFDKLQELVFAKGNKQPESLAIYSFNQGIHNVYVVKWEFRSDPPYYLTLNRNGITVNSTYGDLLVNAGLCSVKTKVTSCHKWAKGTRIAAGPSDSGLTVISNR